MIQDRWNAIHSFLISSSCFYQSTLGVFKWFLLFFLILFNPLVPEKLKNSIFEMPIILQTLNINNLRTTSAVPINLHTISNLIKYSFKMASVKALFTLTVFQILLFECRPVLPPDQRGIRSERVKAIYI